MTFIDVVAVFAGIAVVANAAASEGVVISNAVLVVATVRCVTWITLFHCEINPKSEIGYMVSSDKGDSDWFKSIVRFRPGPFIRWDIMSIEKCFVIVIIIITCCIVELSVKSTVWS